MDSPTSDSDSEYTPNADYRKKPVPFTESLRRAGCFQQTLQRPSCLVEIRKLSQTSLLLPAGFARDFCPRADQKIFLKDSKQRKWPAYWKAGYRPKISSGFKAFAQANRVQYGDVCVLEVIQEGFFIHVVKGAFILEDAPVLDESRIKVEDFDLAENSRKGAAQRGSLRKKRGRMSCKEDDGDGHLQIAFEKDAATGELKFRLKGIVPLEENALEKLKGPFTSGKALLKALFLEA